MKLAFAHPVEPLHDYVRNFQQREALICAGPVIYPIAARSDQILEFYLADRYFIRSCDSGRSDLAPRMVVVGPFTCRRVDLALMGRFNVFTVLFQPAGFHHLFGVPMTALADRVEDARSVLGPAIADVGQKLAEAHSFAERNQVVTGLPQWRSGFSTNLGRSASTRRQPAPALASDSSIGSFVSKLALLPNSTVVLSASTATFRDEQL